MELPGVLCVPGGHGVHTVEPAVLYVFAAHIMHGMLPEEYVPGAHNIHVPSDINCPPGHDITFDVVVYVRFAFVMYFGSGRHKGTYAFEHG